jgi:hypothetical protein
MEPITAHVDYRQTQLRELAESLRLERERPVRARARALRVALGRRLVLLGIALLDGARVRPAAVR